MGHDNILLTNIKLNPFCNFQCSSGTMNPYFECECEDQMQVSPDCRNGFICTRYHDGENEGTQKSTIALGKCFPTKIFFLKSWCWWLPAGVPRGPAPGLWLHLHGQWWWLRLQGMFFFWQLLWEAVIWLPLVSSLGRLLPWLFIRARVQLRRGDLGGSDLPERVRLLWTCDWGWYKPWQCHWVHCARYQVVYLLWHDSMHVSTWIC